MDVYIQTDVIPANAPLANRFGVSSSFDPNRVNHCTQCHSEKMVVVTETNLFELLVGSELDGAVRDDTETVYTVSAHVSPETLLVPYSNEATPHAFVLPVRCKCRWWLNLSIRTSERLGSR